MIPLINKSLIQRLQIEAKTSLRKRKTYNFHKDFADPINRMLNAIEPGSYIRPHKHENPDKREVFLILTGKALVVFFDENGKITSHTILSREAENLGLEIPPKIWHALISLEEGTVVYEVKDGPYNPADDKNFASWAPEEGDGGCDEFLQCIRMKFGV